MENNETFTDAQFMATLKQWLDFGEETKGKAHQGYYSGNGWAARCLRSRLEAGMPGSLKDSSNSVVMGTSAGVGALDSGDKIELVFDLGGQPHVENKTKNLRFSLSWQDICQLAVRAGIEGGSATIPLQPPPAEIEVKNTPPPDRIEFTVEAFDLSRANEEGWSLFGEHDEIKRLDKFESDNQARDYVLKCAADGSPYHVKAWDLSRKGSTRRMRENGDDGAVKAMVVAAYDSILHKLATRHHVGMLEVDLGGFNLDYHASKGTWWVDQEGELADLVFNDRLPPALEYALNRELRKHAKS